MTTALLAARLLLALVFAVAGTTKVIDLPGSRAAVQGFGVPDRLARLAGSLLPVAEVMIAGLLLTGATAVVGAAGALALLIAFTGATAVALAKGRQPDCHCFGQLHSAPAGLTTIARDLTLATVAGFVVGAGWRAPGPSALAWLSRLEPAAVVGIAGGLMLAAVLVFQAWFLLRRHPRLLRVRAVTSRLGFLGSLHEESVAMSRAASGLPVDSPAPRFDLASVGGDRVSLDDLLSLAQPVLLVFMDPACGPCNALLPHLAVWQREHREQLTVVPVTSGSIDENASKAADHGLRRVLVQHDHEVFRAYRAHGTPSAVLLSAHGTISDPLATGQAAIADLIHNLAGESTRVTASPPPTPTVRNPLHERLSRRAALRLASAVVASLVVVPETRADAILRQPRRRARAGSTDSPCSTVHCFQLRTGQRKISADGILLIKCYEGKPRSGQHADCVSCPKEFGLVGQRCPCLRLYDDKALQPCGRGKGSCTIGWGALVNDHPKAKCHGSPEERQYEHGISAIEAEDLLHRKSRIAENAVNRLIAAELDQPQFDALVDFAYNLGEGRLARSPLRVALNCGDYDAVPGLLRRDSERARREAEILFWERGRHTQTCVGNFVECNRSTGQCVPVCVGPNEFHVPERGMLPIGHRMHLTGLPPGLSF